ncbi:MAG: hypothetical protein NC124_18375 [Clostridium sp.]|nr:hypothetical protein [Ruminococcus flavefaciens]MCM1500432.1 hypothetical protein [Clostridium sp.]
MEALMILDFSCYSENIIDILTVFQQIGWDVYNAEGNVEYLPAGDNGEYAWQCRKISKSELYNTVSEKVNQKEQVGIALFYNNSDIGVHLLAEAADRILLSIAVNRKKVKGAHTDMVWYLENIIYKFFDTGVRLMSYELQEYED